LNSRLSILKLYSKQIIFWLKSIGVVKLIRSPREPVFSHQTSLCNPNYREDSENDHHHHRHRPNWSCERMFWTSRFVSVRSSQNTHAT